MAWSFIGKSASSSAASGNLAIPTTLSSGTKQQGDLIIALAVSRDTVAHGISGTGWSQKSAQQAGSYASMSVSWAWAGTGGTIPSGTITHSSGSYITVHIICLRSSVTSGDPFDVVGTISITGTTTPSHPGISAVAGYFLVNFVGGGYAVNSSSAIVDSWTGMSLSWTAIIGGSGTTDGTAGTSTTRLTSGSSYATASSTGATGTLGCLVGKTPTGSYGWIPFSLNLGPPTTRTKTATADAAVANVIVRAYVDGSLALTMGSLGAFSLPLLDVPSGSRTVEVTQQSYGMDESPRSRVNGPTGTLLVERTNFVDTFSDSSLDASRWATSVSGGGAVTEGASGVVIQSVGSDTRAAILVLKESFALGTVLELSVDLTPNAISGDHFISHNVQQAAAQPVVGPSSTNDAATRFTLLYDVAALTWHAYYVDTSGAGQEIDAGWTDATPAVTKRIVFEMNATQARFVVYKQSDLTVLWTTSWVNLSSVKNDSNALWFRAGEPFTDIFQGQATLLRFERS